METGVNAIRRSLGGFVLASAVSACAGCGLLEFTRTTFPEQAVNADGELLFVEDLEDIVQDASLFSNTTGAELADLGIESDELIDAIVADRLDADTPTSPRGSTRNN